MMSLMLSLHALLVSSQGTAAHLQAKSPSKGACLSSMPLPPMTITPSPLDTLFFGLSLRMVCELRGGTDEALRSSREVMV